MVAREISILQSFVGKTSLERLIKYTHLDNFKVETIPSNEKPKEFYGDKMCIIMLWGMIGSFVLKIHFETNTAIALTAAALQKGADEISVDMACDYMKEYCNVQASFIKGFFEKQKLLFGMSLPFTADGHDEIVFKKIRDPRAQYSVWRLSDGQHSLVLTSEICLLEKQPIREIEQILNKDFSDESDDVHFF
jgi:hypothetical protein